VRIAQIAPLYESIPPKQYGGTERIVSYLTEELVNMGLDVTLFASGDSVTKAELVGIVPEATRINERDPIIYHLLLIEQLMERIESFDIVHFSIDCIHFPIARRLDVPHITTLHGRLDLPDLIPFYEEFNDIPVVSISNAQRIPLPFANWQGTVYHGLPKDLYKLNEKPDKYLVFLGRISIEKRPDRAIEIAKKSGIKLKIAAKIDKVDREYFENVITPLLDDPMIEFIGEICEKDKQDFLGNALALLFPIDWPEPFGLVMIESLACGTPVIAYGNGSVPEIIDNGIDGFIVNSINSAVKAVSNIDLIDRKRCRQIFDQRFTSRLTAENYLNIYEKIIQNNQNRRAIYGI